MVVVTYKNTKQILFGECIEDSMECSPIQGSMEKASKPPSQDGMS